MTGPAAAMQRAVELLSESRVALRPGHPLAGTYVNHRFWRCPCPDSPFLGTPTRIRWPGFACCPVAKAEISSQITAAALLFYLNLPAAAHAGLREIEAFGSPEERHNMARAITRAIVGANFEIGRRRAAASMQVANEDSLQTDEDILVEAVRLTTPPN